MSRRRFLQATLAGVTLAALPHTTFADYGARLRWPVDRHLEDTLTLRELADAAGVQLGCALTGWSMNDPELGETVRATIAREFSLATIEHGFAMKDMMPDDGSYSWKQANHYLDWSIQHGLRTRAHALFYPGWATPAWVYGITEPDDMREVIRQRAMMFDADHDEVVVVNEPYLSGHIERSRDPFYAALGDAYIPLAFGRARAYNAETVLIYNDTLNHASDGVNGITTELTRHNLGLLKAAGLIDERFRLGVQMHLRAHDLPVWDDVTRTIASYREQFGCEVIVTEFDCDMSAIGGSSWEWRAALHGDITAAALRAYLRADAGRSFTTWGLGDCFSWLELDMGRPDADPTFFDDALAPKPAYEAVGQVLREQG